MSTTSDSLLVKFRSKDTQSGVTRGTVKAMAKELDMNETQVIHMALSKFANDVLPAYEPDDGPLKASQLKALLNDAKAHMPSGKSLSKATLFK